MSKKYKPDWFFIAAFLNACWIYYAYLTVTPIGGSNSPALLARTLNGVAERPFAYRVLIPWVAKAISPIIPQQLANLFLNAPAPLAAAYNSFREGGYDREAVAVILILFMALVGLAYAQRYFLQTLGLNDPKELFVLPLLTQLFVLPFTIHFGYYYDFPQLVFFTLALGLMLQQKWTPYLCLLAIATFNKETSAFLLVTFAIYYLTRLERKSFLILLAGQALIYGLIRAALVYAYRNNPGVVVFFTWRAQADIYAKFPLYLVATLILFLLLGGLIARGWKMKHPFLKASASMVIIILVLFFAAGTPLEFRIFLDVLAVIVLLILPPAKDLNSQQSIVK